MAKKHPVPPPEPYVPSKEVAPFTVMRRGQPAIDFNGWCLLQHAGLKLATGEDIYRKSYRRFTVTIYKTVGKKYILSIALRSAVFLTQELDIDAAWVCETKQEVLARLSEFDPNEWVVGFPDEEEFLEKDRVMRRHLRENWESQLADICSHEAVREKVA